MRDDNVREKKRRRVPARGDLVGSAVLPDTEMALWKAVRRDPLLPDRAAPAIQRLAERLPRRATRARLRADQARELSLSDLGSADRWWKARWLSQGQEANAQGDAPPDGRS